ncbi:MAG: ABC transporter ATP-binding protein [Bdellovibrionales bacterium]|nr:ABC transporter ATP-binding protein [Bdellovibrionales bacterium]
MSQPAEAILKVDNLSIAFGGLQVLMNVDFSVYSNEIVSLIGPNGAGKTTVFNIISGLYRPTSGSILFHSKNLTGMHPHRISNIGITRTFQNIRLFKDLTVLDNVIIAKHFAFCYKLLGSLFYTPAYVEEEAKAEKDALELLAVFGLAERAHDISKNLPYGEQRKLEIVRALASGVKILLLDEPAAGMNNAETSALLKLIHHIRDTFKITVLLIEHDMKLVMKISDRIIVLHHGEVIADGTPSQIRNNPHVVEAYLGNPT